MAREDEVAGVRGRPNAPLASDVATADVLFWLAVIVALTVVVLVIGRWLSR